MKTFFTFCFLSVCGVCFGQVPLSECPFPHTKFTFDQNNNWYATKLVIDTVANSSNSWQIGASQKSVITGAVSGSKAIITDTLNGYKPNDTSSFIIKPTYITPYVFSDFIGYYNVDCDSLHDYGAIEISLDSGKRWINLLTDSLAKASFRWKSDTPVLTGKSGGWKLFWIDFTDFRQNFSTTYRSGVWFRFTFISDSTTENRDGLAFDDLGICDGIEGISQIQNNALLSLYPNPVTDLLYVERKRAISKGQLQIMDGTGRLLFEERNFTAPFISTKALGLPAGLYFLRFTSGDTYAVQKFLLAP